jgi:DNA repair protein RadC
MGAKTSSPAGLAEAAQLTFLNLEGDDLGTLRERAAAHGPRALDDREALQLMLRRPCRGGPLQLADRLLARFGSLPEVLGAPEAELRQVAPAGVVLEILLLRDLHRRTLITPLQERAFLSASSAVHAYLRVELAAWPREQFRVLFLDKRNRLIRDEVMGWGTIDHAPVYPREIVRRALELNASALILAHNHPSGDPSPSTADIDMTRQVVDACRPLRLAVHDHLLVAGQTVLSFRARGLM